MYNINYINNIYKFLQNNNINGIDSIYNIINYILNDINNYYDNNNNNINLNINNKQIINNFNIKLIDNNFEIYNLVNNNLDNNIIDNIFKYYFNNDNLIYIKDYNKNYNNPLFTEYIVNLGNPTKNDYIFDGNIKINSYLNYIIKKINITDITKLYGCSYNKYITDLCIFEIYLNNKLNLSNNINNNDILIDDIKTINNYDLIIIDFPTNYHNIIYANCCNKIKQLKIRGTKSEPLLLQLIMLSLNKNGRAVVIVNDSLLFNESNQHIKTRQFLIENFNLKKIIKIDENIYKIKGIKNSILYFENNNKTKNVDFIKLNYDNNKITEEFIINIDFDVIIKNNYSLYYKLYCDLNNNIINNNNIIYLNIKDIFNIYNNKTDIINNNIKEINITIIPKYYKNNIKIINYNEINNYSDICLYLIEKENTNYIPNYLNIYIINFLQNKINLFTKGKMNQINIDKIYDIKIPILTKNIQETICNYYIYSNKLYQDNKKQIENYKNMKKCIFDSLLNSNYIELNEIINLKNVNELDQNYTKIIGIIRNGLTTGAVTLIENNIFSNNSYYLLLKNDTLFLIEFIYYYLQYNQNKLNELSNLTQQNSLNKSNLLLFKIPVLLLDDQKYIISYCIDFDNIINKHIENNETIKNKDIMSIINKIYNIN
jgi:hypothetical protein